MAAYDKAVSSKYDGAGSLLSLSALYAVTKLLSFLGFFSVQKDGPVRLPAPTPTSPGGSAATECPQADVDPTPAVLSLG